MNILGFISLTSVGVILLTVGIDVGCQIWVEKRSERVARWTKIREAENLLYGAIIRRYRSASENTVELRVVKHPKKPAGGRHRLTAA